MSTAFNGTTLPYAHLRASAVERVIKEWGYPGVDGLDWMNMGSRGRFIEVQGRSVGGSPSKSSLDSLNDGSTHTLTHNGDSFSDCLCLGFEYSDEQKCVNNTTFIFIGRFRQVEI